MSRVMNKASLGYTCYDERAHPRLWLQHNNFMDSFDDLSLYISIYETVV